MPLQNGNTALILAAHNKHLDVVEALLKAGANVDLQDKVNIALTAGRTPPCAMVWGGPIV